MGRAMRGFLLAGAVALAAPLLPATTLAQSQAPGNQAAPGGNPAAANDATPGGANSQIQALIEEAKQTRPVPAELINALAMGKGNAKQMIDDFLADGNPLPHTVAVRAVALSLAVGNDPRLKDSDRRFALNQVIGDGMSSSLGAPRIMNVKVESGFVPAKGSYAWALGGLGSEVPPGFEKLTQFSPEVGGLDMQTVDNAGDGGVVKSAIENLQSVSLKVPNGQYRVTLLTPEQLASQSSSPFGQTFKVNGVTYTLGKSNAGDWYDTAYLRGSDGSVLNNVTYGAAGLSVVVQVGNGTLNLQFEGGKNGAGSALSGIIMEPIDAPSHLDMSAVRGQRNQVAQTQSEGGQQATQTQQQVAQQLQQAGQQQLGGQTQPSQLGPNLAQQLSLNTVVELEFQTQAAIAAVSGIAPAAGGAGAGARPATTPAPLPTPPTPVTPPAVSPAA